MLKRLMGQKRIQFPNKEEVEKEVKATVIMETIRENPRLELFLTCLNRQTYKNFEFVFVDVLKEKRKKEIKNLARNYDIEMYHVTDKPTNKPPKTIGCCNGENTGIINAAGSILIFSDDNMYIQQHWVERHVLCSLLGFVTLAPYYSIHGTPKSNLEDFPTGELITGSDWTRIGLKFGDEILEIDRDNRLRCGPDNKSPDMREEWVFAKNALIQVGPAWLYASNFSVYTEKLLAVNGFDEEYDRNDSYGFSDCDLGVRLNKLYGICNMMDTGNWNAEIRDEHHVDMMDTYNINIKKEPHINNERYKNVWKEFTPVWVNPHLNLRKLREKTLKKRGNPLW